MKCLQHFMQDISMIKESMNRMEIKVLFSIGETRADILKNFKDWSGGYEPNECDPEEEVEKFMEFAVSQEFIDYFDGDFDDFYYYIYGEDY